MLRKIAQRTAKASPGRFAIVAAKYNPEYTDALVKCAQNELAAAGAATIEVVRVPGSFEVPVIAGRLSRQGDFDVILCFGAILRGATSHAQNIADAVSTALANLQIQTGVPVIHGVLLFENHEQAKERCFGTEHNRGIEAARTALEMAAIVKTLPRTRAKRARLPR